MANNYKFQIIKKLVYCVNYFDSVWKLKYYMGILTLSYISAVDLFYKFKEVLDKFYNYCDMQPVCVGVVVS